MAGKERGDAVIGPCPVSLKQDQPSIFDQPVNFIGHRRPLKNQGLIGLAGDAPIGGDIHQHQLARIKGARRRLMKYK